MVLKGFSASYVAVEPVGGIFTDEYATSRSYNENINVNNNHHTINIEEPDDTSESEDEDEDETNEDLDGLDSKWPPISLPLMDHRKDLRKNSAGSHK